MKKTKRTIMTAALLSTAVMLQNGLNTTSGQTEADAVDSRDTFISDPDIVAQPKYGVYEAIDRKPKETTSITEETEEPRETEMAVLYGPPSVLAGGKGNLNSSDRKLNIADYILLKNAVAEGKTDFVTVDIGDLDGDYELTSQDMKMFERYLFGLAASVTEPIYQTKYGAPPVTDDPLDEPVTTTLEEIIPQPAYGAPVVEPSEEPVPVTTLDEMVPQPEYGVPFIEDEPAQSAVTTVKEEPEYDPEPIQVVYGPPSFFMDEDK